MTVLSGDEAGADVRVVGVAVAGGPGALERGDEAAGWAVRPEPQPARTITASRAGDTPRPLREVNGPTAKSYTFRMR